jgi:hypothetical protein
MSSGKGETKIRLCLALSGLVLVRRFNPGAMPQAGMFSPFRGSKAKALAENNNQTKFA